MTQGGAGKVTGKVTDAQLEAAVKAFGEDGIDFRNRMRAALAAAQAGDGTRRLAVEGARLMGRDQGRVEGFAAGVEAAERYVPDHYLSGLRALRPPAAPAENEALGYATRLAVALWEKHWKDQAPDWKPLPDLMGVLTQIDNATAGLVVAPPLSASEPAGAKLWRTRVREDVQAAIKEWLEGGDQTNSFDWDALAREISECIPSP
jgi:hypothetical protein